MSFGGQGQDEMNGTYGQQGQQQGQAKPKTGSAQGQKHQFPSPDLAAKYYAKATAGNPRQPSFEDAQQGALTNGTEDMSQEYDNYEEEEEFDEQEQTTYGSNMQMSKRKTGQVGGRNIGGNFENSQHHSNVISGMEGLYGKFQRQDEGS